MTTSLDNVYNAFFDKVEQDTNFFAYFEMSQQAAMEIAKERSRSYLKEACSFLRRKVSLDFTLSFVASNNVETFAEAITDDEVYLLSDIMLLFHYERAMAKLQPKFNTFSASELKLLHSPANERQTYVELVNQQRNRVNDLIADYYAKDRLTGKEKMVSTEIPEESE